MSTEQPSELSQLAEEFFRNEYVPNRAGTTVRRIEDPSAALTDFLHYVQSRGADMARWTEVEWIDVLVNKFQVLGDRVVDHLEQVASWGVVDDALWPEE